MDWSYYYMDQDGMQHVGHVEVLGYDRVELIREDAIGTALESNQYYEIESDLEDGELVVFYCLGFYYTKVSNEHWLRIAAIPELAQNLLMPDSVLALPGRYQTYGGVPTLFVLYGMGPEDSQYFVKVEHGYVQMEVPGNEVLNTVMRYFKFDTTVDQGDIIPVPPESQDTVEEPIRNASVILRNMQEILEAQIEITNELLEEVADLKQQLGIL